MEELPLLLGMLEDWKAQINWQAPQPEAAREAGLIAINYWNAIEGWRFKEELERLASILLACPQAIAAEFEELFDATHQAMRFRDHNDILKSKLLASLEGWTACRFLPAVVVSVAERRWESIGPCLQTFAKTITPACHFILAYAQLHPIFSGKRISGPVLSVAAIKPNHRIDLITKLINIRPKGWFKLVSTAITTRRSK